MCGIVWAFHYKIVDKSSETLGKTDNDNPHNFVLYVFGGSMNQHDNPEDDASDAEQHHESPDDEEYPDESPGGVADIIEYFWTGDDNTIGTTDSFGCLD